MDETYSSLLRSRVMQRCKIDDENHSSFSEQQNHGVFDEKCIKYKEGIFYSIFDKKNDSSF